MAKYGTRHLAKPSARAQGICGYTQNYFCDNVTNLADVNCLACLAVIAQMHDKPPTLGGTRYGQART